MTDGDSSPAQNQRILIVDDNPSIHEDFEKILPTRPPQESQLDELLEEFLQEGKPHPPAVPAICYELDHAYQGEEAYNKVAEAEKAGRPYALLFIDIRMPPGWDGIETIRRIWAEFPHNEVVICTAYSDYSWEDIQTQLGTTDQLQFLRKPFDVVSTKQVALALTKKWNLARQARRYVQDLEEEVAGRTKDLREKIEELQKALVEIKELRGILPMCAWCHKIRDDDNYWQQVDEYLSSHTLAEISHGICPDCYAKMVNQLDEAKQSAQQPKPPDDHNEPAAK